MTYTLGELAERAGGTVEGDASVEISGIETLDNAESNQISFLSDKRYKADLARTKAGAVIMNQESSEAYTGNKLISSNPRLVLAFVSSLFAQRDNNFTGHHPTSVLGKNIKLGRNVVICAHAIVEEGAHLEDNVYIGPGSYVGHDVTIGAGTLIDANAVIHRRCHIGKDCIIFSGAVIGADGFGYAKDHDRWVKIEQLGSVRIGNNVEIGANSTVDRGAVGDTIVEDGVKIDNLVQVGHNVRLGENTIIASGAGVAGSAKIGKRCAIGGMSGIYGHITIADDVTIGAVSMVSKSIKEAGTYSSGIRAERINNWQKNEARLYQLDEMARGIRDLMKRIEQLEKGK